MEYIHLYIFAAALCHEPKQIQSMSGNNQGGAPMIINYDNMSHG